MKPGAGASGGTARPKLRRRVARKGGMNCGNAVLDREKCSQKDLATTTAGTTTGDPGHRQASSWFPAHPAACPAAASPAPAATGPAASSDTGCPTTAASMIPANPGPHAAPAAPPAPSARRSPGTPQPAEPPAPHAAAPPAPSAEGTPGASGTAGNHRHPRPPVNHPPRRVVPPHPAVAAWRGMPVFASAISAGWLRVAPRGRC